MSQHTVKILNISRSDYQSLYHAMQSYTQQRDDSAADLIILTEHNPVYTLGPTSKPADILTQRRHIQYVHTNRGGQITFHGPGQIVVYPLINLRRFNLKPHGFVELLETIILDTLNTMDIACYADPKARGIYVAGKKIASLGIRISRGCSYHGFALNVATDLSYFKDINPCGLHAMEMVNLNELCICDVYTVQKQLIQIFRQKLVELAQDKIDISPGSAKLLNSYEY